jgi:hypothetical protein
MSEPATIVLVQHARPPATSLPQAIGRLIVARERLLLAALALTLIEVVSLLPIVASLHLFTSFVDTVTALATGVESDALDAALDGSASAGIALVSSIVGGSLAIAALRCSYLQALVMRDGLPRPQLRRVLWLTALIASTTAILTVSGLSEGAALVAWMGLTIVTLYADYAIALDGLTLAQSLRASARTLRTRARPSIAILILIFWVELVIELLFQPVFDNDATPISATLLIVTLAIRTFVTDCALVTIYRSTPLDE